MKSTVTFQDVSPRHDSNPRAARSGRGFPQVSQNFQSVNLIGNCGTPAKFRGGSNFYRISNQYFAEEAAHNFIVDTGVFTALILTALLPIANSIQAVATLIHTLGVL